MTAKRTATLGILTGLALISYIIESLLPSIALPGAKIGVSNIFTMLTVIVLGLPEGLILIIVRTTLGAIIVGNLSSLIYSCTAGIISTVVMFLMYRVRGRKISIVAISVCSAVVHNLVQNTVFCLVTNSAENYLLLPYLGAFGIMSGIIVGLIVLLILKTIPETVWDGLRKGGKIENTKR